MGRVNYSGLIIAGIGFFLTRFTVTLAVYEEPIRFYVAGILPLTLGLGLAALGVALAVAEVDPRLVRTTAIWCVIGTITMLVLVVLTLLGSTAGGMPDMAAVPSRTYLSNFLIGGSIGGTLTGLYAARSRRQRQQLHSQANRLEVLNRLLRHEVLNALTAIRGYAALQDRNSSKAREVIQRRSDGIEETIEEVKYLTRTAGDSEATRREVELDECLSASIATVEDHHPDASITLEDDPTGIQVLANDRVERVFTHLIENAVVHTDGDHPTVRIRTRTGPTSVTVDIEDEGPGLPPDEQRLLEEGEIDEYDNPGTGFGLNIVRLLMDSYEGSIEVTVNTDGSTISVTLPRDTSVSTSFQPSATSLVGVRPAVPHLIVTLGAALLAGVSYGLTAIFLGGSVGIIGVLYGIESSLVGWIAHEFHSVVFGFVFAGLVTLAPSRYHDWLPAYVAIGIGWGITLWTVAAGIIGPIWLRLVGIPAPLPSWSMVTFFSHISWGITIGVLTPLGYRYLTPKLEHLGERIRMVRTA